MYVSPFTFSNHARSINDRRFLFNRGESLLIGRYWIRRLLEARLGIAKSARPSRMQRLEFLRSDLWFMLGFCQIAMHLDNRWSYGPTECMHRGLAPFVYSQRKSHDTVAKSIPSSPREDENAKTSKLERQGCKNDNFSILLFCLLEQYITHTSLSP